MRIFLSKNVGILLGLHIWVPFGIALARADCLAVAATYHHVSPVLVKTIAFVESGLDPAAHHLNADGSEDLGLMQINSAWLPVLARVGIDRKALSDACVNAFVGTWILAQNFSRLGLTWNAIGAYNASSPEGRLRYARRIYTQLVSPASGAVSPGRVPSASNQQAASRWIAVSSAQSSAFSNPATSAFDEAFSADHSQESQP
jgi:Transglycosylase SLT domain